ncbi:hypothetical protein HanHA89_Chr11g0412221 [Helianthus annuus]|nr:hypothetical protein HanHA89_Chr11g0412221 [Helianthus annuus]
MHMQVTCYSPPPQFLNARNFFIHYLFFKKIYHKIEFFFIAL